MPYKSSIKFYHIWKKIEHPLSMTGFYYVCNLNLIELHTSRIIDDRCDWRNAQNLPIYKTRDNLLTMQTKQIGCSFLYFYFHCNCILVAISYYTLRAVARFSFGFSKTKVERKGPTNRQILDPIYQKKIHNNRQTFTNKEQPATCCCMVQKEPRAKVQLKVIQFEICTKQKVMVLVYGYIVNTHTHTTILKSKNETLTDFVIPVQFFRLEFLLRLLYVLFLCESKYFPFLSDSFCFVSFHSHRFSVYRNVSDRRRAHLAHFSVDISHMLI